MQVLPMYMARTVVVKLDEAVKELRYKSRMAFIRDALVAFLRQDATGTATCQSGIRSRRTGGSMKTTPASTNWSGYCFGELSSGCFWPSTTLAARRPTDQLCSLSK